MNQLEIFLAKEYKKEYAYFTGNGTTALYLIFKALNITNRKILFPNITCMAPVNAAIYAGYEVTFCDVNIDDFTMNIESLREAIHNDNIGIVVPTHIYGHICNTKEIYDMCKEKGIVVIEDSAQSVEISDYNDFSITSFGHTKIFETERGGGTIFYKDESFSKKFDFHSVSLKSTSNSKEFKLYSEKYYSIAKNFCGNEYYSRMKMLQLNSKEVFLRHFKSNEEIVHLLNKKENIILDRKKRLESYQKELDSNYFIKLNLSQQIKGPLWRFSVLVKNINRDKFVDKVRRNNIDISTWYPCLHRFYNEKEEEKLQNSIYIADKIVNFWITEKYSEKKILDDINKLNIILKEMDSREEF